MERFISPISLSLLLVSSLHAGLSGVVLTPRYLPPDAAPSGFFPTLWCVGPNGAVLAGNVALYRFEQESRTRLNTQATFSSINIKDVAVASDGGVIVSGRLAALATDADGGLATRMFHLAKLKADGSPDLDFSPVFVAGSGVGETQVEIGVTRITPDEQGGCYAAGRFNFANGSPAVDLIHVDRFGHITALLHTRTSQVTNPWCIVRDGATLIVINTEGMVRVTERSIVQSFQTDDDVQWNRINGAVFDPRFGICVIGTGTIGNAQSDTFASLYNTNGTRRRSFSTAVRFDSAAGGGNAVAWDNRGRVIVGFVNTVRDPERTDGDIQLSSPLTGPVLEGVPSVVFSVKRLLPNGRLDPEWSRAVWFDRPPTRVVVLPNDDVVIGGDFSIISGQHFPANLVQLVGGLSGSESPAQQSVRGWIDANDKKLIMGLVISGRASRDVLVRAVGPSLRRFGVPIAPEATRLSIFQGERMLLRSSFQANTLPVMWAGEAVGAFPLEAANREAQALISLLPGNYTIVIDVPNASLIAGAAEVLGEVYFP